MFVSCPFFCFARRTVRSSIAELTIPFADATSIECGILINSAASLSISILFMKTFGTNAIRYDSSAGDRRRQSKQSEMSLFYSCS